jgi:DNA-binding MarR family transcriptional regulator
MFVDSADFRKTPLHDALIPFDTVDDFIILRARAFTSRVRRAMIRDVLQPENVPLIEWQLVFSVARFGTCHLAKITQETSLDPAHGSRAAASLEKKGLIERCDDPTNRRRKLISLTPNGMELVSRIWPRAQGLVKTVTQSIKNDDLDEIKRLLDLLNNAAKHLDERNDDG